jgi:hypothetical protein
MSKGCTQPLCRWEPYRGDLSDFWCNKSVTRPLVEKDKEMVAEIKELRVWDVLALVGGADQNDDKQAE